MITRKFFQLAMVFGGLLVFVGSVASASASAFFNQFDDADTSLRSHYSDNWYRLGTGFSGTIHTLTFRGAIDNSLFFQSQLWLDEFNNPEYSNLNQTYTLSNDAPFESGEVKDVTISGLNIVLDPTKYYRLRTYQGRQNASVKLKGTNATGTAMYNDFVFGVGRVETLYSFYPYISVNGATPVVPHNAVVIVPGMIGSRLNRVSDGEEVWPNVNLMIRPGSDAYLDELKLDDNGVEFSNKAILPSSIIDKESTLGVDVIFYKNLIDNFINHGHASGTTLFTAPFDWRFDVRDQISKLKTVVDLARAASPTGKVDIVAHSTGGLLVKAYVVHQGDTDGIDHIIFAGVPNLGSPKAFKLLNFGDDFDLKKYGLGLNDEKTKDIGQNMPGPYNLLPSRGYIASNGTEDGGAYVVDLREGRNSLTYQQTSDYMVERGRNEALLSRADLFHQAQDGVVLPLSASTTFSVISGCQKPMIGGFNLYQKYQTGVPDEFGIRLTTGDGTVPLNSANSFDEATKRYFVLYNQTQSNHLGLVKDETPLALITNIVDNKPDEQLAGISQQQTDCLNPHSSILVASHSPVHLHVYDSQSHHTGVTGNGDIELGIPESDFFAVEDNNFVLLPQTGTYRVALDATATGTFDLDVTSFSGAVSQKKTVYLNVPLASDQTNAQLVVTGDGLPNDLQVDQNGDGTFEAVVAPSADISGQDSQDITPPVLALPIFPESILQNSTTTLVFDVTDTQSGVASIVATLNGETVGSNQLVSFMKVGDNVFRLRAQDRAGNPIFSEVHFVVTGVSRLIPVADTYIREGAPNRNEGTEKVLSIKRDDRNRDLVKFDLEGLKTLVGSSGAIVSAKLQLTTVDNDRGWGRNGSALAAHALTRPWTEHGATWNCADDVNVRNGKKNCPTNAWDMRSSSPRNPWLASSTAAALITNQTNGVVEFDVTADVQKFLNGQENNGWIIKKQDEQNNGKIMFSSREGVKSPKLVVLYRL